MSFLQPWMLFALPLIAVPILIHLINQWRYQTKQWGGMMFLLAATRMNRGFAKVRQWLILAARTLAIGGLIFAIARPLASGLLGMTSGGRPDTTIILLDRSPSMQAVGAAGLSKLETGRQQLASALKTIGSAHWVTLDQQSTQTFETLDGLMNATAMQKNSATADLPSMMQAALDYVQTNKPSTSEIWICSDLRQSDWKADSGTWAALRQGFEKLPLTVRFHLLAYPDPPVQNLSIRVTDVRRAPANLSSQDGLASSTNPNGKELLLSLRISRNIAQDTTDKLTSIEVPVQIEIDGVRSELKVTLAGKQTEVRQHRITLAKDQAQGWGRVSLPADSIPDDNEFFFVYSDPPPRRVVLVTDDRQATRALEIAAAVSSDGQADATVEVLSPEQVDSLDLDQAALLLWQASLPQQTVAPAVIEYLNRGGQAIFFPPTSLMNGSMTANPSEHSQTFLDIAWKSWVRSDATDVTQPGGNSKVMVENWRGDQGLFAATDSGAGLPVGQLELSGYARLESAGDKTVLASLTGGFPLLVRAITARGVAYFMTVSPDPKSSSLADSGIVLFVAIQRAIERGQAAIGETGMRIAGEANEVSGATSDWQLLAGDSTALSTQYTSNAGVYQTGDSLLAVNRSVAEDQTDQLSDEMIANLFDGLSFARVNDSAGSSSGIVREIWRVFLIVMIIALILEAVLCLPRVTQRPINLTKR